MDSRVLSYRISNSGTLKRGRPTAIGYKTGFNINSPGTGTFYFAGTGTSHVAATTEAETLTPDEIHEKVYKGAQICCRWGAQLIKTYCTKCFRSVTARLQRAGLQLRRARLPPAREAWYLDATLCMYRRPPAFQRAFCGVVKGGVTPDAAVTKQ